MPTPREKVLAKIAKRKQLSKKSQKKKAKKLGPYGITKQFTHDVEKAITNNDTSGGFEVDLDIACRKLDNAMKCVDPDVSIEVIWVDGHTLENWKDIQVDGINISWSRWYLKMHEFAEREKYIDIAELFLKGLFDEEYEDLK